MKNFNAKLNKGSTRRISKFVPGVALVLLSFAFGAYVVHAAGAASTFTESQIIALPDSTPPSTPTNLGATPISQSEIDLSWSPSTDNIAVGGYVVFRDGVAVATTTDVSFADTLLIASTTYTYAVEAFDTSYNYSALSTPVSTSTLPILPIPPSPTSTPPIAPQGGSNSASSLIYDVTSAPKYLNVCCSTALAVTASAS